MSAKLKPSTKEYVKVNNKLTNKFVTKHHTPSNTSTEELKKLYENSSYKKKKGIIQKELIKRGKWENLKKK
jgi:translation elongation factor EF-4